MALDGAFLNAIKSEISPLVNGRVDKIYQPSREEVIISIRTREGVKKLYISANAGSARVHVTSRSVDNPQTPPMFCMLLRKHLGGGRLINIRQDGLERILFLDFECVNELGDVVTVTLACEIMGRCSNLVIISGEGRIIDSIKRVDSEMSRERLVLPGMTYEMPPRDDRLNFLTAADVEMTAAIRNVGSLELSKAIIRTFEGISPILAREWTFFAGRGAHIQSDEITDDQLKAAVDAQISALEARLARRARPEVGEGAEARGDGLVLGDARLQAVVDQFASGSKIISAGNNGDVLINQSDYANVTLSSGAGNDTIYAHGYSNELIDLTAGGADRIFAPNGAHAQGYDASSNAAFVLDTDNVFDAIVDDDISFGNGSFSVEGAFDAVSFNDSDAAPLNVNFVDQNGNLQRVTAANSNGGIIDGTANSNAMIYVGDQDASSTLVGSDHNDSFVAGANDHLITGGGTNTIALKNSSNDGATIDQTVDVNIRTVNNISGYDALKNVIRINAADLDNISGSFRDDQLTVKIGNTTNNFVSDASAASIDEIINVSLEDIIRTPVDNEIAIDEAPAVGASDVIVGVVDNKKSTAQKIFKRK